MRNSVMSSKNHSTSNFIENIYTHREKRVKESEKRVFTLLIQTVVRLFIRPHILSYRDGCDDSDNSNNNDDNYKLKIIQSVQKTWKMKHSFCK